MNRISQWSSIKCPISKINYSKIAFLTSMTTINPKSTTGVEKVVSDPYKTMY